MTYKLNRDGYGSPHELGGELQQTVICPTAPKQLLRKLIEAYLFVYGSGCIQVRENGVKVMVFPLSLLQSA